MRTLVKPWKVTLANHSVDTLEKYTCVNVVVGGVSIAVPAFTIPVSLS